MAEWSLPDIGRTYTPYESFPYVLFDSYCQEETSQTKLAQCPPQQAEPLHPPPPYQPSPAPVTFPCPPPYPGTPMWTSSAILRKDNIMPVQGDNPRVIRNKAEKQRRDKLNKSIADLAVMVPPVAAASRKIDKTGVLRLTAHYLRAHQYVFGDSLDQSVQEINPTSTQALLKLLKGFLLTVTYKGIIVVVSQNVQQFIGYTELDLLGQSLFNIIHMDDHKMLKEQITPKSNLLGPNGELLVPDEPDGKQRIADLLAKQKRSFMIRFKKPTQRSEPVQYITCHVEGSLRKSDRACRGYNRCCQMVRRARARGDNPRSSGNDVVFIGLVRPTSETFMTESGMESFSMEYRTRHSVDGEIIHCDQRIALVTGYMTQEVKGVNAMNFMHRDDVRWVIIALREMYDQHRLYGESCYRLMAKNGEFVYMRTRGHLEVDPDTRAVTSFVCTNSVVKEDEGKELIRLMKKKFTLLVNNNEEPPQEEESVECNDNQIIPVEDPRQLEKVILHLVTNLPSPQPEEETCSISTDRNSSSSPRLAIIPPKKERIISAIEKMYSIFKTFKNDSTDDDMHTNSVDNEESKGSQTSRSPQSPESRNLDHNRSIEHTSFYNLHPISRSHSNMAASSGAIATSSDHQSTRRYDQLYRGPPSPIPTYGRFYGHRQPVNEVASGHYMDNNLAISYSASSSNVQNSSVEVSFDPTIKPPTAMPNTPSSSSSSANISHVRSNRSVATVPPSSSYVPTHNDSNASVPADVQENAYLNPLPGTSGTKRPHEVKEQEPSTLKKKVMENELDEVEDANRQSPIFDNFINEAMLNNALNAIEQSIDPLFSELLMSDRVRHDVQEFLDKMERERKLAEQQKKQN